MIGALEEEMVDAADGAAERVSDGALSDAGLLSGCRCCSKVTAVGRATIISVAKVNVGRQRLEPKWPRRITTMIMNMIRVKIRTMIVIAGS